MYFIDLLDEELERTRKLSDVSILALYRNDVAALAGLAPAEKLGVLVTSAAMCWRIAEALSLAERDTPPEVLVTFHEQSETPPDPPPPDGPPPPNSP